MKSSNKKCLLMFLLVLGTCNIGVNNVLAQEDNLKESAAPVQENIKVDEGDFYDKAVASMDKKDYQSAIVYLTNYITAKPKKYEGYKLRGDAFYALRQYILAQQDYQTAIEIKAGNDKFITGTKVIGAVVLGADRQEQLQNPELGNLYARLMYAQKALNNPAYESAYSKAVEYNSHIYLPKPKKEDIAQINCPQKYGKVLNPQGVDSYIYGAIEDIENGNFNEAIYKAQYITSNYPKFYLGYYLTGVSMVGLDNSKEAIPAFETALKYNPYDFESFASLGQIYYQDAEKTFSVEDAKKSVEYFNKALKYNPNCYLYYYYIGLNELQTGSFNSAISNFNSAIKFKSNDYNSMYYKLIAQYVTGDYNAVIDGTTRMLYRHVSNYNSVLYLRALTYNKLGNTNLALADLEKIQNGVDDIYNADVKVISPKERTLDSYIYYLKAQIINEQGFGAKADMAKALQNPIIAKLSAVEKSLSSYKDTLNSGSISYENYNKYNSFYSSELPKLLDSNLVITVEDIDNQYDYIRTTFDDLGISFKYLNPNYKLTTIDNFVEKKYSQKIADKPVQTDVPEFTEEQTTVLKQSTDQMDTLAGESQTSIAQMLATQSLGSMVTPSVPVETYKPILTVDEVHEDVPVVPFDEKEKIATEPVEVTDVMKSSDVKNSVNEPSLVKEDKKVSESEEPVVSQQQSEPIQNIDKSEQINKPVYKSEGVKIVADEIKQSPDVVPECYEITPESTYSEMKDVNRPNLSPEKVEEDTKIVSDDKISKKVETVVPEKNLEPDKTEIKDAKNSPKVVEKHADVDLNEFDFVHKPAPDVDETSDVVKLDSKNLLPAKEVPSETFAAENVIKADNDDNTEDLHSAELSKEDKTVSMTDDSEPVIIPEPDAAVKNDKNVAVPVVLVPEISESVKEVTKPVKEIITKVEDEQSKDVVPELNIDEKETPALELRPQVVESTPLTVAEDIRNPENVSEKVTNLKTETDKKVKAKKEKLSKSASKKEKDTPPQDDSLQKKSFWAGLFPQKRTDKDEQILDSEKTVKVKTEKVTAENLVESESDTDVTEQKRAKKVKEKKEPQQSGEDLISSFVQSTFGSTDDTVENKTPAVADSSEPAESVEPEKQPEKVKSKKSKKVDKKQINTEENNVNEEIKPEKFSFKGFFARFKKSNSADKSSEMPVNDKEQIQDTDNFLPLDEIQSETQTLKDVEVSDNEKVETIENQPEKDVEKSVKKGRFWSKSKKEKIKSEDLEVNSDSNSVSEEVSTTSKKEARKKDKELKKANSKAKKNTSNESEVIKSKDDVENNTLEDADSTESKKPLLRGKQKDKKTETGETQPKQKVHVPSSKDTYEIYVKDDKQKKIIKKMDR